jgi:uncharacterized membrane protein
MALGAFFLSFVTIALDQTLEAQIVSQLPFVFLSQPAGARSFLSTVAGSMLGVAGVSFSILMVVLPMASAQFGPRLLNNFMRDRGSQTVLGAFIATFLYCLLVLRTVRGEGGITDAAAFVPQLSLAVALLLAVFNLGMFIYFIHHAAGSIQVEHLLARVNDQLRGRLLHDYPEAPSRTTPGGSTVKDRAAPVIPADFDELKKPLNSARGDYLLTVDEARLVELAQQGTLLIELRSRPGDFVMQEEPLAFIYPGSRLAPLVGDLLACFTFGSSKTATQDLDFLFEQFVEVGLRALSPGINDPFTAMRCIDRIADNLSLLARRRRPEPYRYGRDGDLRLITPGLEPLELVPRLFGPLRSYGQHDFVFLKYLLDALARMAELAPDDAFRQAVITEAGLTLKQAQVGLLESDYVKLVEYHTQLRYLQRA